MLNLSPSKFAISEKMGKCYICGTLVEPNNDETLLIGAIAAIYGIRHVPRYLSARHVIAGDTQATVQILQNHDDELPHAHIYPVGNCQGIIRAQIAAANHPDAYEVIQSL